MGLNKENRPPADFFPSDAEGTPPYPGAVTPTAILPDVDLCLAGGDGSITTLTNLPSGETTFLGRSLWYNARGAVQVRGVIDDVITAGSAGSKVRIKFRTAAGGTRTNPGVSAATVDIPIDSTGPQRLTGWVNIDPDATNDVLWDAVGLGGDGTADPQFSGLHVQFRFAAAPVIGCAVPADFAQNDDFASYANDADFQDYATGGQTPSRPLMYDWGFWNLSGGLALDTGVKFAGHNTLRSTTIYDSAGADDFVEAGQIGGRFSDGGSVGNTETAITYDTQGIWVGAVLKFGAGFATRDTGSLVSGFATVMVQLAEAPYLPCQFLIQVETQTDKVELYKLNLLDSTQAVVDTGIAASSLLDGEWHLFALHVKRVGGGPIVFDWDVKAYVGDACSAPVEVASMLGVVAHGPGPDAGIRYFTVCGQGNGIDAMFIDDVPMVANIGYFAVCPDTVNPDPFAP